MPQTLNNFAAESNNQNELFSCTRIKHTGIRALQFNYYKTYNKKTDLQNKRINRKVK